MSGLAIWNPQVIHQKLHDCGLPSAAADHLQETILAALAEVVGGHDAVIVQEVTLPSGYGGIFALAYTFQDRAIMIRNMWINLA